MADQFVIVALVIHHNTGLKYPIGVFDSEEAATFCFEQSGGKQKGELELHLSKYNPGTPGDLKGKFSACLWYTGS